MPSDYADEEFDPRQESATEGGFNDILGVCQLFLPNQALKPII